MLLFSRKEYIKIISITLIFCLVTLTAGYADSIQTLQTLKATLRVPLGKESLRRIKRFPINPLSYNRGSYPTASSIIFALLLLPLSTQIEVVNTSPIGAITPNRDMNKATVSAVDSSKGAIAVNTGSTDMHNPIIKGVKGAQTIKLGETFRIEIIAEAPDGGPLKYAVANGPGEMYGNVYTWTPEEKDVGHKRVIISVRDSDGHIAFKRLTLIIEKAEGFSLGYSEKIKKMPIYQNFLLPNGRIIKVAI